MKEYEGVIIDVMVVTGSSENRVVEIDGAYKVWVSEPPEDGKANKKVIQLLAKYFGVSKSSVSIVKGVKNKKKLFKINDTNFK